MASRHADISGFHNQHAVRIVENLFCGRHGAGTAATRYGRAVALLISGPSVFVGILIFLVMFAQAAMADEMLPSYNPIEFKAQHQLANEWILLTSVVWPLRNDGNILANEKVPDAAVPVFWNDTSHYILGLVFAPAVQWKVSAELAVDQDYLDGRMRGDKEEASGHNYWVAAGIAYQIKDNLCLNLVYTHMPANERAASISHNASTITPDAVAKDDTIKDINRISAEFSIHF